MRKVLLIFTIFLIITLSTMVSADESKSYISTFFADKNVSMNIVD